MHVVQKLMAALVVAGVCSAASAAGKLVINPAASTVSPGDTFSLKVMGADFTDIVVGGGFNLNFDASILALDSVSINTALWEFVPGTGSIDNAAGTLSDVSFNTFLNSPTGNFDAATLNFRAKAAGTSGLALSESSLFPFANTAVEVITVSYGAGQVTAVPEPTTVATLLFGLGLLTLLMRRRA